ncbi:MAG TPA: hypothetical protein VK430_02970 [Xanthobacteraceae bacterium]|nr:hypothetical protein [Xanthobacteraceae bacterium]
MVEAGNKSRPLWRLLVGGGVAYAIAAQSLLIALGAVTLAAHANESPPAIELCAHDAQAPAGPPAHDPGHPGCIHCIFCFAGSHHGLIRPALVVLHRLDVEIAAAPCAAEPTSFPTASACSIANPRGPPLRA